MNSSVIRLLALAFLLVSFLVVWRNFRRRTARSGFAWAALLGLAALNYISPAFQILAFDGWNARRNAVFLRNLEARRLIGRTPEELMQVADSPTEIREQGGEVEDARGNTIVRVGLETHLRYMLLPFYWYGHYVVVVVDANGRVSRHHLSLSRRFGP